MNTYRVTAVDRLTDHLQRAEVLGVILGFFVSINDLVSQFSPQLQWREMFNMFNLCEKKLSERKLLNNIIYEQHTWNHVAMKQL